MSIITNANLSKQSTSPSYRQIWKEGRKEENNITVSPGTQETGFSTSFYLALMIYILKMLIIYKLYFPFVDFSV